MFKHPHFQLYLHGNDELEPILKMRILERSSLHEWPLSSVELLKTEEGKRWLYKSQTEPSVEADFYAKASSPLLLEAIPLKALQANHQHLLIPYLEYPLLETYSFSADECLSVAKTLIAKLAEVRGDFPVYLDLGTAAKWQGVVSHLMRNLEALMRDKTFQSFDARALQKIQHVAFRKDLLDLFSEVGLVHGDLKADNVFLASGDFKVIDWQRPLRAPKILDLVCLLESFHLELASFVNEGALNLFYLLQIHWLTECSIKWFPDGAESYDRQMAELVAKLKKSSTKKG